MTAKKIEDMLHRRTDLSTFLIHFTKSTRGNNGGTISACDNLISILDPVEAIGCLKAKSEQGMAKEQGFPGQKVVCFTETPLEQAWTILERVEERREVMLEPYGVVFSKIWARQKGVNPVWYIDQTPGHDWLTNTVDEMVKHDVSEIMKHDVNWQEYDGILKLTPFFESMGTWRRPSRKEFWWEREWRKVDNLQFSWAALVAVLAPEDDHEFIAKELEFRDRERRIMLDPLWGLERMISALSGIQSKYAGPLPEWNS